MQKKELHDWAQLQEWLNLPQWQEQHDGKPRFAFRGQADASWLLQTSLSRHFKENPIGPHAWRRRELKMYRMFRERLLQICPGMYDGWDALDIMALMQHHGVPTRMLDFTFCPGVAAYFALKDTQGESTIWVVDREFLENRRKERKLPDYCGPTHKPKYDVFHKEQEARYRSVGSILHPARPNERLAAQRGCFFVPGSISREVDRELVHTKVTLSERLAIESLSRLKGLGYDRHNLFPNLDRLADEVNRFSVTGAADFACANSEASQSRGS